MGDDVRCDCHSANQAQSRQASPTKLLHEFQSRITAMDSIATNALDKQDNDYGLFKFNRADRMNPIRMAFSVTARAVPVADHAIFRQQIRILADQSSCTIFIPSAPRNIAIGSAACVKEASQRRTKHSVNSGRNTVFFRRPLFSGTLRHARLPTETMKISQPYSLPSGKQRSFHSSAHVVSTHKTKSFIFRIEWSQDVPQLP